MVKNYNVKEVMNDFKNHEIRPKGEFEWLFKKDGTGFYASFIIIRNGRIIVTGDIGHWIFIISPTSARGTLGWLNSVTKRQDKTIGIRSISYFCEKIASREREYNQELTIADLKDKIKESIIEQFLDQNDEFEYFSDTHSHNKLLKFIRQIPYKPMREELTHDYKKILKTIETCHAIVDEYDFDNYFPVLDLYYDRIRERVNEEAGFYLHLDHEDIAFTHIDRAVVVFLQLKAFLKKLLWRGEIKQKYVINDD